MLRAAKRDCLRSSSVLYLAVHSAFGYPSIRFLCCNYNIDNPNGLCIQELGADGNLYSLVFGESVLNDAVAIVMYK